MKDKYVIVDFVNMSYMRDEEGKIKLYETEQEALLDCGMYEFTDVWVCKLVYNHQEDDVMQEQLQIVHDYMNNMGDYRCDNQTYWDNLKKNKLNNKSGTYINQVSDLIDEWINSGETTFLNKYKHFTNKLK